MIHSQQQSNSNNDQQCKKQHQQDKDVLSEVFDFIDELQQQPGYDNFGTNDYGNDYQYIDNENNQFSQFVPYRKQQKNNQVCYNDYNQGYLQYNNYDYDDQYNNNHEQNQYLSNKFFSLNNPSNKKIIDNNFNTKSQNISKVHPKYNPVVTSNQSIYKINSNSFSRINSSQIVKSQIKNYKPQISFNEGQSHKRIIQTNSNIDKNIKNIKNTKNNKNNKGEKGNNKNNKSKPKQQRFYHPYEQIEVNISQETKQIIKNSYQKQQYSNLCKQFGLKSIKALGINKTKKQIQRIIKYINGNCQLPQDYIIGFQQLLK